jgi:hypothetical protein
MVNPSRSLEVGTKKPHHVGMSDFEVMYKKGVPATALFAEADIQAKLGTLEVGARDFLRTIGWRG